jgi:hypothetical protein
MTHAQASRRHEERPARSFVRVKGEQKDVLPALARRVYATLPNPNEKVPVPLDEPGPAFGLPIAIGEKKKIPRTEGNMPAHDLSGNDYGSSLGMTIYVRAYAAYPDQRRGFVEDQVTRQPKAP